MFNLFFLNDTAPTEIYTLSLHDALPISGTIGTKAGSAGAPAAARALRAWRRQSNTCCGLTCQRRATSLDRKSTRLNSSHANISYAVFCLKKKKYNNVMRYVHTVERKQK